MAISQKDIKLLWGRAASRCAFPDCRAKLTQDKSAVSDSVLIGEQAHIVAEESDGPRGESRLPLAERNSYYNLILLCPTHHAMIDKNPEDYPVEKLHIMKGKHETWVEESLSETLDRKKLAHDTIYSSLIDATVEDCHLQNWEVWTSYALSADPSWDGDAPERLFKYRQKIIRAAWPGTLPELEKALITFSIAIHQAVKVFNRHCKEMSNGALIADKFYKIDEWNEKLYHELLEEYKNWREKCYDYVFEATKAANWLADVIRRDINPSFFATDGKFIITHGPFGFNMSYRTELLEYTEQEKSEMPKRLLQKINEETKTEIDE